MDYKDINSKITIICPIHSAFDIPKMICFDESVIVNNPINKV
jgi:hypothetical protein